MSLIQKLDSYNCLITVTKLQKLGGKNVQKLLLTILCNLPSTDMGSTTCALDWNTELCLLVFYFFRFLPDLIEHYQYS